MPVAVTKEDIKDYVVRRLGGGKVSVELTEDQIDDAIQDATDKYAEYLPALTVFPITVSPNIQMYDLDTLATTQNLTLNPIREVLEVTFHEQDIFSTDIKLFNVINWTAFQYWDLQTFYLWEHWQQMAQKVLNAEFEFEFFRVTPEGATNVLFLTNVPPGSTQGTVWYTTTQPISSMRDDEIRIVKDLAHAYAMQTLGRVRSKFGSFPSPGGDIQLDGSALLQEAKEELESIEKKLQDNSNLLLPWFQ